MPSAGNSYVESPGGQPENDNLLKVNHYERSRQQQIDVGLLAAEEEVISEFEANKIRKRKDHLFS